MERKLIPDLFSPPKPPEGQQLSPPAARKDAGTVSLKEFEHLVSRLNKLEKEVQTCQTRTQYVYAKVLFWLTRMKSKKLSHKTSSAPSSLTSSPTP